MKFITSPSTVLLAVVANALYSYAVSAVRLLTVADRFVPVAATVVQSVAELALYIKPCAVIASLPAVIVPFKVAPSCVMLLAARVFTVGGVTTTAVVVKLVLTHAD